MRVAAIFIGIIGVAYYLNYERILIESKNIILTTSSGEKIILDSEATKRSKTKIRFEKLEGLVNSETNNLVYEEDVNLKELVKNTIKVPYGKRFKLTL